MPRPSTDLSGDTILAGSTTLHERDDEKVMLFSLYATESGGKPRHVISLILTENQQRAVAEKMLEGIGWEAYHAPGSQDGVNAPLRGQADGMVAVSSEPG